MGCDGGSIPKRGELVKVKAQDVRPDKRQALINRWFYCALSKVPLATTVTGLQHQLLQQQATSTNNKQQDISEDNHPHHSSSLSSPIVSCPLGKLFTKEAVLKYLLNPTVGDGEYVASHITSLKDVVTLNLTLNPVYVGFDQHHNHHQAIPTTSTATTATAITTKTAGNKLQQKSGSDHDHEDEGTSSKDDNLIPTSPFICPILLHEMNGTRRFSYLRTCGCVMSEKALKEVPDTRCLVCSKQFTPSDIVCINPSPEEQALMLEQWNRVKEERKRVKKEKGSKKKSSHTKAKNSASPPLSTLAEGVVDDYSTKERSSASPPLPIPSSQLLTESKKRKFPAAPSVTATTSSTNATCSDPSVPLSSSTLSSISPSAPFVSSKWTAAAASAAVSAVATTTAAGPATKKILLKASERTQQLKEASDTYRMLFRSEGPVEDDGYLSGRTFNRYA